MRYPCVIEPGDETHAFGVIFPDCPGCYSGGDTLEEALNNENYRPIFCNIYHQLSNIFSDVHDERKITDDYHGLVEQALIYSTESLRGQSESVETLTEAIKNKQADELSVMFSLILQQARFGSVVIENESKLKSNELLDCWFFGNISEKC